MPAGQTENQVRKEGLLKGLKRLTLNYSLKWIIKFCYILFRSRYFRMQFVLKCQFPYTLTDENLKAQIAITTRSDYSVWPNFKWFTRRNTSFSHNRESSFSAISFAYCIWALERFLHPYLTYHECATSMNFRLYYNSFDCITYSAIVNSRIRRRDTVLEVTTNIRDQDPRGQWDGRIWFRSGNRDRTQSVRRLRSRIQPHVGRSRGLRGSRVFQN